VNNTIKQVELNPNIALQLISIQLECLICSLYCRIFHLASCDIGWSFQGENYSAGLP